MPLMLSQRAPRGDNGAWDCSVQLDGPATELDQVESVTYLLMNRAPAALRQVRCRDTRFRLDSPGPRPVGVLARVRCKDGRELVLED